jgi:hypothetical protein
MPYVNLWNNDTQVGFLTNSRSLIPDPQNSFQLTIFGINSLRLDRRWDHIYRSYKSDLKAIHGFAELCFQCNEWITGKAA